MSARFFHVIAAAWAGLAIGAALALTLDGAILHLITS